MAPTIAISLALALLDNRLLRDVAFYRTVFSSTIGVCMVCATLAWLILFNPGIGLLNEMLSLFRLAPGRWLADPRTALLFPARFTAWKGLGFNVILLPGGLQSIPEELYDSASIDGAGPWRRVWNVTLPMVSLSLHFLPVISTVSVLPTFAQVQVTTRGGPAGATNLLVLYPYHEAFFKFHLGSASAITALLFLFILTPTLFQFRILEGGIHYQSRVDDCGGSGGRLAVATLVSPLPACHRVTWAEAH